MREIKYRGKSWSGKWVYGSYLHDYIHNKHLILVYTPMGELNEVNCDPNTIGIMLGEDKNNKKIYEGDVVMIDGYSDGFITPSEVKYYPSEGSFGIYSSRGTFQTIIDINPRVTVLGNYHDKPELVI